jgi:hypothetical protein
MHSRTPDWDPFGLILDPFFLATQTPMVMVTTLAMEITMEMQTAMQMATLILTDLATTQLGRKDNLA